MSILCLADDSHEISSLVFSVNTKKKKKKKIKMPIVAVVISTLRVENSHAK